MRTQWIFSFTLMLMVAATQTEPAHAFGRGKKKTPRPTPTSTSNPNPTAGACSTASVNAFRACYYKGVHFETLQSNQVTSKIDFNWTHGAPSGLPNDYFSARYLGRFDFEAGSHRFTLTGDDGIRLWVDGKILIDSWEIHPARTFVADINLSAGQHEVRVEYFEKDGDAVVKLDWEKRGSQASTRRGIVRLNGGAIVDDDGGFHAVGASLFLAAYWYRHDREKLERNLEYLSQNGYHYFRALGMVGWHDIGKAIDPNWHDYREVLEGVTDLAYDKYGLRVQWTMLADAQVMAPSYSQQRRVVDTFLSLSRGREHKIMHFEVANEHFKNGVELANVREFSRYMKDNTDVLVAGSSPLAETCEDVVALYGGGIADVATLHFERELGSGWRAVRQPFSWRCSGDMPEVASDNEPIGPGSSIASERDPVKLVAQALIGYISRVPFYVFHSRAGVGRDCPSCPGDLNGSKDISEMPGADAFRSIQQYLPADVSNWNLAAGNVGWNPVFVVYADGRPGESVDDQNASTGVSRIHTVTSGNRFVSIPSGIRLYAELEPRMNVDLEVIHPVTGEVVRQLSLSAGERFRIDGLGAYVLKGTIR